MGYSLDQDWAEARQAHQTQSQQATVGGGIKKELGIPLPTSHGKIKDAYKFLPHTDISFIFWASIYFFINFERGM